MSSSLKLIKFSGFEKALLPVCCLGSVQIFSVWASLEQEGTVTTQSGVPSRLCLCLQFYFHAAAPPTFSQNTVSACSSRQTNAQVETVSFFGEQIIKALLR
jgi:hypothetical protein